MQMKVLAAAVASAAFATSAQAAVLRSSEPIPVFHVTGFAQLCTASIPQECATSFNLSINAEPSANCRISPDATDYVLCGVIDPEQAYYAYIQKPAQESQILQVEFITSFPGNTTTIFGRQTLPQPGRNFDIPASAESATA